ncbi:MAG TPA: excinuclease ABC subunit B, partial [Marinilabiliaceae bacterium]|nr:excinuclease ABC subunit B [Marinilabiliaceae bacterium]
TGSMRETIEATNYRREKQLKYNEKNGIIPRQVIRKKGSTMPGKKSESLPGAYVEPENIDIAADPVVALMSPKALEKAIDKTRKSMEAAAKELDFISAAQYRDEMYRLQDLLKQRKNP